MANFIPKVFRTASKKPISDTARDEQSLKYVSESGLGGLWNWDLVANEIYFSPRWKEMIGFGDDELHGSVIEWEKRIHPYDLTKVKNFLNSHLEGKTPIYECEFRVVCKDGSYKWVLDHGKVTSRDGAGKPLLLVSSYTDITDYKASKEKINALVTRFESATHAAKIGVLEWDILSNTVNADRQFYALYDAKPEDFAIAHEGWLKLLHPKDKDRCEQELQYALIARRQFYITFQVLWSNGSVHSLRIAADIIRDVGGKPIKLVGVQWDVTREQEIDRQKSEFVSLASHQLRTPLTAIRWFTELLIGDQSISEEQRGYVQEIYKGDLRMIELVNALLNVSRLELGTFNIDPKQIDVIAMVKSVLTELKPQIIERAINIVEEYGENMRPYLADTNLMRIIFQNLLSNAVKYTKKQGKVWVKVAYLKKDSTISGKKLNQDCLVLVVADTGIGIPAKQQDKIFTKLFRAENAQMEQTEGTGLGLYLLKEIVDQSGGASWFTSEENKGTSFFVVMPSTGMTKMTVTQH